jgi:hypothetical protein
MTNLSAKSRKNIRVAGGAGCVGSRILRSNVGDAPCLLDAVHATAGNRLMASCAREWLGWVPRRSLPARIESADAWSRSPS